MPNPEKLREMRLLLLEEGHCFRDQALSFCNMHTAPPRELLDGFGALLWVRQPVPDVYWSPETQVQEDPARHAALCAEGKWRLSHRATLAALFKQRGYRTGAMDEALAGRRPGA